MPQTSLLTFFTSPAGGTPSALPAPKPWLSSFKPTHDASRTFDHSAHKSETNEVPKMSPRSARSSQFSDHIQAGSSTTILEHGTLRQPFASAGSVEEEKEQELGERNDDDSSSSTIFKNTSVSTHHLALPHCPSVIIAHIEPLHLPALRSLTSALLPIRYPDTFYDLAISDPTSAAMSRIALYTPAIAIAIAAASDPSSSNVNPTQNPTPTSTPIGWIRCSLEPCPSPQHSPPTYNYQNHHHHIYIKALCLLAPYRGLGVATALLDTILQQKEMLRTYGVKTVFAHVWEHNDEALQWYEKRGFARDGALVEGYYRKLRPQGAWIVRREVGER